MAGPASLLPGTLDLLILKAVSLEPMHGYGVLWGLGRFPGLHSPLNKGRSIPRFTSWSIRGCSNPNGEQLKTIAFQVHRGLPRMKTRALGVRRGAIRESKE